MYVQGFLLAVAEDKKAAYREVAAQAGAMFAKLGVVEIVECWEDDVPDGKVTDFRMATKAEEGEKIVFSWMIWPDKATCDAAKEALESDPSLMEGFSEMPFDGTRMIWGGFEPVFVLGR